MGLPRREPATANEIIRTSVIRATDSFDYPNDGEFNNVPSDPPLEQFDIPLTNEEIEQETKELLTQVPEYCHDYLDIFRQKQGTETLPPSRDYDMPIDLVPLPKLAAAKLYQLTEAERQVLLETIERETKAGRI